MTDAEPVTDAQREAIAEPADESGVTANEPSADAEPVTDAEREAFAESLDEVEPLADAEPTDLAGAESAPAPGLRFDLSPVDPADGGRPISLRLAGIHLHAGLHALARAELEAFAGRGRLDEPALLDLAEVRWRTGDLAGAGDAANALLARGREDPLALVIAAEAVAALGRPGEARRLAGRVAALDPGPLAPLFAGMPMATIWPDESAIAPLPDAPAAAPDRAAFSPRRARAGRGAAAMADAPVAAAAPAAEAFAGGRGALAAGDHRRAALLLGVALRLEPGFAGAVLGAVAGRDEDPLLALVEGDALRLLGRETEALAAFDRASGRRAEVAGPRRRHVVAAAPGLFDEAFDDGDEGAAG